MRRRSKPGREPAKARRRKTVTPKRRKAPKAVRPRSVAAADHKAEVARLTGELKKAREQQSALAEVLGAISRSRFELQPVLEIVAQTAARLCRAKQAVIFRLQEKVYRFAAVYSINPAYLEIEQRSPISPGPGTLIGRVAITRQVTRIDDAWTDRLYEKKEDAKIGMHRSMIGVPLMREGKPMGVIGLSRSHVDPFSEREIELVTTFADQAVIAIENVRLFEAEQQRTRELTQSLEQQTAASEVLQTISSSPGDLEPVFASMLEKAVRICNATFGGIYRVEGDAMRLVATHNVPPMYADARRFSPFHPGPKHLMGRMMRTKSVVQIGDAAADTGYVERRREMVAVVELGGARTMLAVPILRENNLVGALFLARQEVCSFNDKQIALVTNFANQAAIAIENARLLNELRERTSQLEIRSEEVVKLNQQLEQRVADQVGEIERMGRLRRFLPPQVADLIVASGTEKQLEGHRREITALFCDLRGFTGFTESADAEDVMALLREYHAAIGEIIIRYSGTLERYAGDGVMVVFKTAHTRKQLGILNEQIKELAIAQKFANESAGPIERSFNQAFKKAS